MRSYEELETLWQASPTPPRFRGRVALLVARLGDGERATPDRVELTTAEGLVGDRWSRGRRPSPDRQLTLMNATVAELVGAGVRPLHLSGDNVLVDLDLSTEALPTGTRLRLGTAEVIVTAKPHLGCATFLSRFGDGALRWVNDEAHRSRRLRGVNCRVLRDGVAAVGDLVEHLGGP